MGFCTLTFLLGYLQNNDHRTRNNEATDHRWSTDRAVRMIHETLKSRIATVKSRIITFYYYSIIFIITKKNLKIDFMVRFYGWVHSSQSYYQKTV